MENRRQMGISAIASVLQIFVNGVILFLLYRFLVKTIGAEQFGIWSLVMAFTSFTQVANLGFSGSVVKFVAKGLAHRDSKKVALIIQTAVISIAIISGALILAAFPLLKWALGFVVTGNALSIAQYLLPFSMAAFWFMMIAGISLSSLDGYLRTELKAGILALVNIANLLMCYFLVPSFGLPGLAYSLVFANFLALFLSWLLIRKLNPEIPFFPATWDKETFKEIVGYAGNFQLITLLGMLTESVTKAFLGRFASLSYVAYYEMATRMILQIRGLLVSGYQVLVPVISTYKETSPEKIPGIYARAYDFLYYMALPVFGLLFIWMPLVSQLWIGHNESLFIFLGRTLAIAWLMNILAVPAYVASLGMGELKWNVLGHGAAACLNLIFGFLGGVIWGGKGVVWGWFAALIIGSIIVSVPYQLKQGHTFRDYIPRPFRMITGVILVGGCAIWLFGDRILIPPFLYGQYFFSLVLSFFIIAMVLIHPLRQTVQRCVFTNK